MHRRDKNSQHSLIIWPVWLNGWVFVYELSGCGFDSSCSHLNINFHTCFDQGVPWHSGNYRVWIHSERRTCHDENIKSMRRADKNSQHSSIIWPVWLNDWVFVYEGSGCWFGSSCSHSSCLCWETWKPVEFLCSFHFSYLFSRNQKLLLSCRI